ncbi:MAG: lysophospholipid acyltransferase family protein [Alphaproteobacteria bacterium]
MSLEELKHRIEAFGLKLFYGLLRMLPLDAASWLGGFLARLIGPMLKAQRIAKANIARFMPHLSEAEQRKLLRGMWDHLGRVAAELPHISGKEIIKRVTFIGSENMPKPNEGVFFFSGHFGNWELLPEVALKHNVPITLIYREANNPYADKIIADIRAVHANNMFPKGTRGAVKMARAIKNNEAIAMLIDQKMNDGIAVPFFGVPAMTAPAIAQLALRYDLPILPAYVLRKSGAHFEAHMFPALEYEKTGDAEKDTLAIMTAINQMLEGWIRAHPEQWFWVHKRWPAS